MLRPKTNRHFMNSLRPQQFFVLVWYNIVPMRCPMREKKGENFLKYGQLRHIHVIGTYNYASFALRGMARKWFYSPLPNANELKESWKVMIVSHVLHLR